MNVIPTLAGQRHEFKASVVYIACSRTTEAERTEDQKQVKK